MGLWFRFEDLLEDLRGWAKRRLCRHRRGPAYEEVRTHGVGGPSWTAMFVCPDCEEVLGVEASYHGDPDLVRQALDGETRGN